MLAQRKRYLQTPSLRRWRPGSWVDVDMTGTVAEVAGYPTTNRVWFRAAAAPLAADVQRMTADVASAFRQCGVA